MINNWDLQYQQNKQISIYPWTDLVSYVMRYGNIDKYENRKDFKVLELGCGVGANIPLFYKLGVDYYAIEGSQTAIDLILDYYYLDNKIKVDDFCKAIDFDIKFDLIVDRAAVTHNTTDDIKNCLDIVYNKLKPNGKFIGIDWFSMNHSDYISIDCNLYNFKDVYTCCNFKEGQFKDVGKVHFSNEKHINKLFSNFKVEILEEKIIKKLVPISEDNYQFASWNFVARKEG
jgi:SAM-dependent methyltransferase